MTILVKVEIWSDVVCPWCYIGKRHFEEALASFAHADEVEIEWKSYELDPGAPREREGAYVDRLASKYGVGKGEAQAMISRVVNAGAEAGIEFRFDISRPGNTFDAHRLLHLAKKRGVQNELEDRLFASTFTEGRAIGDVDTLVELAGEAGLDVDEAREVLVSDAFADDVRADEQEAAEIGVRGVPFFVFDRKYGVSGAQPAKAFAEVLQRVWREANPIEVLGVEGAGICDDDSCAI
ncbi:MAG TPA: DsbA family oxidoreductase [Acidimicrobiales bacterium]|nr:DsbA family oxidoreductase [Acidimicrobiales bacterium]